MSTPPAPATPAIDPARDTKTLLLDTAERIFADRGFDAATLRAITAGAGVNLAAAHYHFGSKEALFQAALERRIGPLNRERLEWLKTLERDAGDAPVPIEAILQAFLAPTLDLIARDGEMGRLLHRLISRVFVESRPEVQRLMLELFSEVIVRFGETLCRSLPDLAEDEVYTRFLYGIGVMTHALVDISAFDDVAPIPIPRFDADTTLCRMVGFIAAGLRAPVWNPHTKRGAL